MRTLFVLAYFAVLLGCKGIPVQPTAVSLRALPKPFEYAKWQPRRHPQLKTQKQLFAWFDALGFSSTMKKGRFAQISRNSRSYFPSSRVEYGFLIRGSGNNFSALLFDLNVIDVEKGVVQGPISPWTTEQATAQPADAKQWLRERKRLTEKQRGSEGLTRFEWISPFLTARLAELRGLPDIAKWFLRDDQQQSDGDIGMTYSDHVQNELAGTLFRRALRAYSDVSRGESLKRMKFIADNFSAGDDQKQAANYTQILTQMCAEDAVRQPLEAEELAKLSTADRVAELIWQLRNQPVGYGSTEDMPSVFRLSEPSKMPATLLADLGFEAVPALIDALDNKNLIHAELDGMHATARLLRVRDAAVQILSRIASQSIALDTWQLRNGSDADFAKLSEMAKLWWEQARIVGEKDLLVRVVAGGDHGCEDRVVRLVAAYPTAALAAIQTGVKKCPNPYLAAELLVALKNLREPGVLDYARDQMLHAADQVARVAAAKVVFAREPSEASSAMIEELDKPAIWADLVRFLAGTGRPDVMTALSKRLDRQPAYIRASALAAVIDDGKPAAKTALEDLLVGRLLDRERAFPGAWSDRKEFTLRDPRICDYACLDLAELDPKRYTFMEFPSERARDEQCTRNLNVWRRGHQLTEIKVASPTIAAANAEPLFLRFAQGRAKEADIMAKGLGVLPPLIAFNNTVTGWRRKQMEGVATRLANTVREVKLLRAPTGSAAFAHRLQGFVGKPLTLERFATIADLVKLGPGGAQGGSVVATKDGDGLGFLVTVDLGLPGAGDGDQVGIWQIVLRDGKQIRSNGTSLHYRDSSCDPDFVGLCDSTLRSPPSVSVMLAIEIRRPTLKK